MTRGRYWRGFALPGVAWLALFVVVPAYAMLRDGVRAGQFPAAAGAGVESGARGIPASSRRRSRARCPAASTGRRCATRSCTSTVSLALCFAIGYPVAYYVARHARRTKTLLIVLLVIPFWVSYLLRMLAWIGLLSSDGYVNQVLPGDRDRASARLAQRQRLFGDPGARVRLHPVLHPARVRGPRPDRPQPDRGRARPRRDARSGRSCTSRSRSADRASSRARRSSCCRCSATTTPTT